MKCVGIRVGRGRIRSGSCRCFRRSQHFAPQKLTTTKSCCSTLTSSSAPPARSATEFNSPNSFRRTLLFYQFRNGIPLTTEATANFTRGELATALRKNLYTVNILLAGYDKETGQSLYYIDYISTLHKIDKGGFGYGGSYFSLSMMDLHYRSGMAVDEAIILVDKCIAEIRSRLVVAPPNFVIKIVDKDGAREYAWRESVKDVSGAPTV